MTVKKELYKRSNFHARSSKCPLCGKLFKSDECPHSIVEAHQRLDENYIRAIFNLNPTKEKK